MIFDVHELQKHLDAYVHNEMVRILPNGPESGLRIRKMISKGKAAPEINEVANEETVDLIVMGMARGSVTSQVIETGTQPVFAIPAAETTGNGCEKISRILIAIDFSNRSGKVVEYACSLGKALGAVVHMIYVTEKTKWVVTQKSPAEGRFACTDHTVLRWELKESWVRGPRSGSGGRDNI